MLGKGCAYSHVQVIISFFYFLFKKKKNILFVFCFVKMLGASAAGFIKGNKGNKQSENRIELT